MNLSDNEKRDVIKYLESGKPLPEKYRFLLFDDDREVELVWNGKTNEVSNTVLPFQTIEHIDEPRSEDKKSSQVTLFDTSGRQIKGWTNKLIWGDNKLILSSLKNGPMRKEIEAQGGLKLVYIDPPFSAGIDYSINVEIGGEERGLTKTPSVIEEFAYRNTWGNGGNTFLTMLYERVILMRDLLHEEGIFFLRIDHHWGHYVKAMLDELFGKSNFQSEILVSRIKKNVTGQGKLSLPTATDSLFVYFKSELSRFKHINFDLKETREEYWRAIDSAGVRSNPDRVIESVKFSPPAGRHFTFTQEKMDQMYKEGRIRIHPRTGKPQYKVESSDIGILDTNWTDIAGYSFKTRYPTENALPLLERVINISTEKGDLVADFFSGSGTTLEAAEKLGRKWIGTDVGRFSIHTIRKRMVGVQRELKKEGKNYRAFEILNVGKYEREYYVNHVSKDLREEEKRQIRERKEKEYINLILSAYKAEPVESFNTFVGKKRDRLVAIGSIDLPITSGLIQDIVKECKEKKITKADVLGFDYEMGLDFEDTKKQGLDIQFKKIPREVFDKKAVEKGQVKFYDVAYLEAKPIVKGRGSKKTISVELVDFSVFYNQEDIGETEENLRPGGSKVVIENGQVIKLSKDKKTELIEREVLTKNWTDWVDYWAVDFDFENRKEIVKVTNPETKEEKEEWTGGYIFENEWQSFRTKKDKKLELTSSEKEVFSGKCKIAVKVVDIFGNDTTKIIEVKV